MIVVRKQKTATTGKTNNGLICGNNITKYNMNCKNIISIAAETDLLACNSHSIECRFIFFMIIWLCTLFYVLHSTLQCHCIMYYVMYYVQLAFRLFPFISTPELLFPVANSSLLSSFISLTPIRTPMFTSSRVLRLC